MKRYKKLIILILGILIVQSCTFTRSPEYYPLIVTKISKSDESEYNIYTIRDSNPNTEGWGHAAMYIELKDRRHKFQIGDTIVFNKK